MQLFANRGTLENIFVQMREKAANTDRHYIERMFEGITSNSVEERCTLQLSVGRIPQGNRAPISAGTTMPYMARVSHVHPTSQSRDT